MLTKEKEAMVKAARNLHGSMLIEWVKGWKRGELDNAGLLIAAKTAVDSVEEVAKSLENKAPALNAKPQEPSK